MTHPLVDLQPVLAPKVTEKVSMVARKYMKKNTQVAQSASSSGSVKQFKWFSQRVQTSQLADADVSISLQIRLR